MNSLDWFAQLLLAGIFLFAGLSKFFAFQSQVSAPWSALNCTCIGMTRKAVCAIAILELAFALALIGSLNHRLPEFLPLLAASGLALLMTAAGIYHDLRRESAAPVVALFLLALFVIVGHLLG